MNMIRGTVSDNSVLGPAALNGVRSGPGQGLRPFRQQGHGRGGNPAAAAEAAAATRAL